MKTRTRLKKQLSSAEVNERNTRMTCGRHSRARSKRRVCSRRVREIIRPHTRRARTNEWNKQRDDTGGDRAGDVCARPRYRSENSALKPKTTTTEIYSRDTRNRTIVGRGSRRRWCDRVRATHAQVFAAFDGFWEFVRRIGGDRLTY